MPEFISTIRASLLLLSDTFPLIKIHPNIIRITCVPATTSDLYRVQFLRFLTTLESIKAYETGISLQN